MKSFSKTWKMAVVTALLLSVTRPAKAETGPASPPPTPDAGTFSAILETANSLGQQWGVDPSNPVLVAGLSVLALRWGVAKLWNLRTEIKARVQARDQATQNNAIRDFFADLEKHPQLGEKARGVVKATEKVNEHVKPCAKRYPLILSAGAGLAAVGVGGLGLRYAYNKAAAANKTLKELKAEEAAKDVHAPLKKMDKDDKQKEVESLHAAIAPAASQVAGAMEPFIAVLEENLLGKRTGSAIASARGRTLPEHEKDVKAALDEVKTNAKLAFQLAVVESLGKGLAANETPEERLRRFIAIDNKRKSPEYQAFVESTTERFLIMSMPTILKTGKQYTDFLKPVTRDNIASVVDAAIRSLR